MSIHSCVCVCGDGGGGAGSWFICVSRSEQRALFAVASFHSAGHLFGLSERIRQYLECN